MVWFSSLSQKVLFAKRVGQAFSLPELTCLKPQRGSTVWQQMGQAFSLSRTAKICRSSDVYVKTGLVCLIVFAASFAVKLRLTPASWDTGLRWALSLAIVQIIATVSLAFHLLVRRTCSQLKERVHERLRPAMRDRISALASAGEPWSSPVPERGPARQVLEESIAHALFQIKGAGRERVAQFALNEGFAAGWVKAIASNNREKRKRAIALLGSTPQLARCAELSVALQDKQMGVRTAAARALLTSGDSTGVAQVFRAVLRESLLTRALLASDMKRHASSLLANVIPSILAEAGSLDLVRCLEMMTAWKQAIPSFDVSPFLNSGCNRSVLLLTLQLLPYLPVDDSIVDRLRFVLLSGDSEVQCAAARAVGQLKLKELIPALTIALNQNGQFAIASAAAIAQMGKPGQQVLEKIVSGSDRKAASLAMGALEFLTVGV